MLLPLVYFSVYLQDEGINKGASELLEQQLKGNTHRSVQKLFQSSSVEVLCHREMLQRIASENWWKGCWGHVTVSYHLTVILQKFQTHERATLPQHNWNNMHSKHLDETFKSKLNNMMFFQGQCYLDLINRGWALPDTRPSSFSLCVCV